MKDFPKFPIGFGGAAVSGKGKGYGFGDISDDKAIELLHSAFEQGIRLFDSAPIYGFGESEKKIAQAFKQYRDKVFIVSKSGLCWDKNFRVDKNNDPKIAESMLDQSLKDLKIDYIDLYMIHWPDDRHDIRKTMEVLSRRKEKGDILHIGLCNTFEEDFHKASEIDEIEAIQDTWNAFSWYKTYKKYEFLKNKKNIYKMGYATLDKGILSGRVDETRKFDAYDCRSWAPWWKVVDKNKKYDLVKKLEPVVKDYDLTLFDFALHFAIQYKSFMDVNLIGFRNLEQLNSGIKSLNKDVSKKQIEEILSSWQKEGYNYEEDYG